MKDLTSLGVLVFKQAIAAKGQNLTSSPYSRFFLASTIDSDIKTLVSGIGKILHTRGLVDSATPVSISFDEAGPLGMCVPLFFSSYSVSFSAFSI